MEYIRQGTVGSVQPISIETSGRSWDKFPLNTLCGNSLRNERDICQTIFIVSKDL